MGDEAGGEAEERLADVVASFPADADADAGAGGGAEASEPCRQAIVRSTTQRWTPSP
ncbi:hypothetical protein ACFWWS_11085 [Streptomyces sp. NPDC059083]|uniref:hypothetical protein n=1 Tax=unclassified Streptomyces TaxID=2593676 RepID=UPI0036801F00